MINLYKTITFLLFSAFSLSALAENTKEIHFKQLTPSVQREILKHVSVHSIKKIEVIHDENTTKFEIESIQDGLNKDITLSKHGAIIEIEQSSSLNKLSTSALQAIKHDYPGLKIAEIESVQTFYTAIEGTVKGKNVAFKVFSSGDIEDDQAKESVD
tara:strand:+ start:3771 stop:4241 length:471 start_codon:yes stop_codon:yes gene_type:complete